MDEPDYEQEHKRLAELYAAMSDGELESIAQNPLSLTDASRQALQGELGRRHLGPLPEQSNDGEDAVEWEDLVVLKQFRDLPEALLAKGSLASAGIESFLADDNMVRMDWFISNLVGGIKLSVRPQDADTALEMLEQPIPADLEVEGEGAYRQPACPHCESLDISFEALHKPASYTAAWVGIPIPFPRRRWKCQSCGHKWRDAEDE